MASKHYLKSDRLGDVLAAIQAMGSNEKFRQDCEGWTRIILGPQAREDPIEDPINDQTDEQTDDQTNEQTEEQTDDQTDDQTVTKEQTNHWKDVFDEHPEFFRRARISGKGKERYSLIWRRALPIEHMKTGEKVLLRYYRGLPPSDKKNYWRPKLSEGAVQTLMAIAIEMHTHALEEKHWWHRWISPVSSFLGASAGAAGATVAALYHEQLGQLLLSHGPG